MAAERTKGATMLLQMPFRYKARNFLPLQTGQLDIMPLLGAIDDALLAAR